MQNLAITSVSAAQNQKSPGIITEECADGITGYSPTEGFGEELGEHSAEETDIEQNVGRYAKPIYQGDGFGTSTSNDSECGEPCCPQHIRIDFSPVEGLDNEHTTNKCLQFWAFLEKHPEIKGLRTMPSGPDDSDLKTLYKAPSISGSTEPKAMDWLENHEDMMSKAFATKHRERFCGGGSGDNCLNWISEPLDGSRSNAQRASQRSKSKRSAAEDVSTLCKQLEEWDLMHPHCMEGPAKTPHLSQAVMNTRKH